MRPARATYATFRPHDLLWIGDGHDLRSTSPVPAWATRTWLTLAPVVVRRETVVDDGMVPVGLRGSDRSERFAGYVPRERVRRRVTPESLAQARAWRRHAGFAQLPCVRALNRVAPELDRLQLTWGITGSVGFALASGINTLRSDSDLDLLLCAAKPLSRDHARSILSVVQAAGTRVDIQVDTGDAGFALADWAGLADRVLLKTGQGPMLAANPWVRHAPSPSRTS
ncbi:malonate decarboxylase holo-ACP synthase [Paraburkholderia sp. LEh10]|uniref:malonate decarboxylase holo-ACP synthase n=1 Tax=Paraburkholderia sp. LEh10 TaxID=2821353 RepID=UPI001AEA104A|nr:malonate decarboxylase holo-ACP synthase [Paraburkholderia sp. LEh10]MBP0588422.1 malonate decarboxylase holo-ACP synthase [Paraburkholderia sp. LEh10]